VNVPLSSRNVVEMTTGVDPSGHFANRRPPPAQELLDLAALW
jgi:hypothetical protein